MVFQTHNMCTMAAVVWEVTLGAPREYMFVVMSNQFLSCLLFCKVIHEHRTNGQGVSLSETQNSRGPAGQEQQVPENRPVLTKQASCCSDLQ